jgi:galactitol PTS system EIIC component
MNFNTLIVALNSFLDLGVPVIAPTLLFLLALLVRVPFGRALRAAFTYGIGFIGIFLILDLMLANIATGAEMLVERTGVSLEIIDVGWPVDAAIAFGVPTFVTVFFGAIIVNLVMFALRWTITLDIDFHNYYQWVIPATLVYFFTDNLIAGTIVGLVNFILTLKIADWTEKDVAEFWELPGVSIPHTNSMGWWPFAYMVDWIIDRIPGLNKIRIDVKGLQEKIGVFGEPMIIGGLIGIGLGIGAGMSTVDTINLMLNLGASMILMPRMISLLMEGLVPVFQSARKWVLNRFPNYDFRIGLDAAVLIGKPEVLVIGMLMTPVMILLAFIMPGNRVLPFADLSVLNFFCLTSVGVNRGNLFRGFLIGTLMCAIMLLGANYIAPTITEMGQWAGFETDVQGLYTTIEGGSIYGAMFINMLVYALVNAKVGGWAIAGISVVACAVLLFVFKKVMFLPRKYSDLTEKRKAELYPESK